MEDLTDSKELGNEERMSEARRKSGEYNGDRKLQRRAQVAALVKMTSEMCYTDQDASEKLNAFCVTLGRADALADNHLGWALFEYMILAGAPPEFAQVIASEDTFFTQYPDYEMLAHRLRRFKGVRRSAGLTIGTFTSCDLSTCAEAPDTPDRSAAEGAEV